MFPVFPYELFAYPDKRLLVSCWLSSTYEFQKEFPSWNFLVPREELFSSSGVSVYQTATIKKKAQPLMTIELAEMGRLPQDFEGRGLAESVPPLSFELMLGSIGRDPATALRGVRDMPYDGDAFDVGDLTDLC